MAAKCLSKLLRLCTTRSPCPNPKVVKNLQTMLCSDEEFTPVVAKMPPSVAKKGCHLFLFLFWKCFQRCDFGKFCDGCVFVGPEDIAALI